MGRPNRARRGASRSCRTPDHAGACPYRTILGSLATWLFESSNPCLPEEQALPAQLKIMRVISLEERNLNAIEPSRFDFFEVWVVLLGNMSSPQKQIHADFHNCIKGELFLGTGKYIFNITEPMRIETGIG
jgi:hypothetical protein